MGDSYANRRAPLSADREHGRPTLAAGNEKCVRISPYLLSCRGIALLTLRPGRHFLGYDASARLAEDPAANDALVAEFEAGRLAALARGISVVGDDAPGLGALFSFYPRLRRAHRIGVTGPPGTGKSRLAPAFVRDFRNRGELIGVVTADRLRLLPAVPFGDGIGGRPRAD
jgi:hypothetical protein